MHKGKARAQKGGNAPQPSSLKCSVVWAVFVLLGASLQLLAQEHAGQYAQADIQYGSRVYAAQCSVCHGPTGDQVSGVDLRSGKFRNASSDDDLRRIITNGIPGTSMPSRKLDNAELVGIVAYIRNMRDFNDRAVALGDRARGQAVFEGKGRCTSCHRVNGKGSRVAPDLSDIGTVRAAGAIQQSLLDPTAFMMPVNRPVRAVTRDRKVINGRRLNEDTYTVQLIDEQERLVSLAKTDLREYTIIKTSPMPSYKDQLRTGALLWKANLGGQIVAGPMSYQVDGKQYVAIAAGHDVFAFALRE